MTIRLIRQILYILSAVLLLLPYGANWAEKSAETPDSLKILGWVEFIRLEPGELRCLHESIPALILLP